MGSNSLLAQVLNGVTLAIVAAVVVGVPLLVGRDARHRGLSRLQAMGWGLATLALLPIGLGLYVLLGRSVRRPDSDEPA